MRDNTKTEEAMMAAKKMLNDSGEKIMFKRQEFYPILTKIGLAPTHNAGWLIDRVINILMYNGSLRRVKKGLYEKTNYGYGKKR